MKRKRLENNPEVQKRVKKGETTKKKDFQSVLKQLVKPTPSK